jgi:hypothetical protein
VAIGLARREGQKTCQQELREAGSEAERLEFVATLLGQAKALEPVESGIASTSRM